MTIKIPTHTNWDGTSRSVDGAMERLLKNNSPAPVAQKAPSKMQSSSDFWRIPVNYRNGIYHVDLAKSLLDNGNSRTPQEWAEFRKLAEPNLEFYTGDMPLYHAIFTELFKQKDKPESEEARKFIQEQMRARWLVTLTRVAYSSKGKDRTIHNFGTSQKYELEENIAGPDRIIEQKDSSALIALLGTGNIEEIKAVYNWINQTSVYLWRLNKKPNEIEERVARFVANSGWASLSCWGPGYSIPSLGVRAIRRDAPKAQAQKI